MVSQTSPTRTGEESAKEAQDAIEELVRDLGAKTIVAALLRSSLAGYLAHTGHADAALRVTQVLIRQIVFAESPQLEAEIIALGAGVILADETTMGRIAAKHGICKAAVSKRVVAYVEANGLPPSQYMRAEKDRATYAKTNRPRTA